MDRIVGLHDAKTHLNTWLDRIENLEALTIARNGRPIAPLVPTGPPRSLPEGEATALGERFHELRESLKTAGLKPFTTGEIVELVHAGRKYWRQAAAPALVLDASVPLA